jgi:uncharacterized protein (TIGR02679 family)
MLDECVEYFKNNKAYKRIFVELRRKWKTYGKPSGYVIINNATQEEKEAIKLVMGKGYSGSDIKLKVSEFEAALRETKFKDIGLQELLEAYFSESMATNKNVQLEKANKKRNFFEDIQEELADKHEYAGAALWLQTVLSEKKYGYHLLVTEYERSEKEMKIILFYVFQAIARLQQLDHQKIRLAVLSAEVTSNPHYFDRGSRAGKLLIHALSFINGITETQNAEEILTLYYSSGIQLDDISSHTALYGINLYTAQGLHQAYETFIKAREPYIVALSNLNKIVKADCKSKIVFALENPMVFSHLCEGLTDRMISMICTSGQMKTASLLLIDLLCESGCKIYYSGDIDPEGLGIADRVIARHPEHIFPWRMTIEDYELSISNEPLDDTRIKKLDRIKDARLNGVVNALRKEKKAGYQELLIESLFRDIKTLIY